MRCWNCDKEIPDDAKACQYCEALTELAPSEEEMESVEEVLSMLDDESREAIEAALDGCESAEEFANRIMVGECPTCGSAEVGDCGDDPTIDNICLGRCFNCGQMWCLDCGELLEKEQTACAHEEICDRCDQNREDEPCEIFPADCPIIIEWLETR